MKIINFLKGLLFSKNNPTKPYNKQTVLNKDLASNKDSFADVLISLNKNYEIEIQVFFDDILKNKNITEIEYALVVSEFFYIITSGKLEDQILDILVNQIKQPHNESLLNRIFNLHFLMKTSKDKDKPNTISNSAAVIKPSQVFAKYKNG